VRKTINDKWERIGVVDIFSDITNLDSAGNDRSPKNILTSALARRSFSVVQGKRPAEETRDQRLSRLQRMIDEGAMVKKQIEIS